MNTVGDLVAARDSALASGDKALAREIYHHLQTLGIEASAIDAGTVDVASFDEPTEPESEPEPEMEVEAEGEPAEPPVVEAAVAEPVEAAVKPKPRGRPRSNS